jgi:hypothetical protein
MAKTMTATSHKSAYHSLPGCCKTIYKSLNITYYNKSPIAVLMIFIKHSTSMCITAEVRNLLASMLRYSGYLDKGFFHNLEQCPSEFKHIKKLQKINDSTFK